MAARGNSSPTLGFLTVVHDPEHGLFGGYLALNAAGRPLEFHCTAPVRANRAQEILYGTSLTPYLYGELIGATLVSRVKTSPLIICTDQAPALEVRSTTESPVVLVLPADGDAPAESSKAAIRVDRAGPAEPISRLIAFNLGEHRVAVAARFEKDRRLVEEAYSGPLADFDLAEPFSRIREALQEARPSTPVAAPKPTRPTAAASV